MKMKKHHFLLISCPAQGHINPTLQLAKRLISTGAHVTFATTVHGLSQIKTLPSHDGLTYASFSDGYDNGTNPNDNPHQIMSQFKMMGSQTLTNLIQTLSKEQGRPLTFLVNTLLLPWAADVARDLSIHSAFLCIQSATVFALYHRLFNTHDGIYDPCNKNVPNLVKLQGLPSFAHQDLPSFLLPTSPVSHTSVIPTIQEHIQTLEKDPNPCVLFNTFDSLEEEIKNLVPNNMKLITVGPLISSALSEESFSCDLFDKTCKQYIQWLNSKPSCSVVYVSFGSMAVLDRKQMDEIFHGLVDTHRPFLWVIRNSTSEDELGFKLEEEDEARVHLAVHYGIDWTRFSKCTQSIFYAYV